MRLGIRVLELLKEKELKQNDLAAFLNTKPSTVSGWRQENRNPSSDMILPICEFLNISPTYLYTGMVDNSLTIRETELINLFRELPIDIQSECIGFMKGCKNNCSTANHMESVAQRRKA